MYRVFLYIAFLVFCSAAPYGDRTVTRTIDPPQLPEQSYGKQQLPTLGEQRDETDLVDSSGSGYSYFRHQSIGSRPVEEQRVAINEPLLRADAGSNQYSNYAKSSAFKTLPVQDEYSSGLSKSILSPEQGPYGSALSSDNRVLLRDGYGQEKMLPHATRVVSNGYGQPQFEEKTIIKVKTDNGYGSSFPTEERVLVRGGYGEEKVLPPATRVISNGYGQEKLLPAPVKVISNGYGSSIQTDDRFLVRDGYGQEKMLPHATKVVSNGYGQPQFEEKTIIKVKTDNGYGSSFPTDNRVLVRGGYGEEKVLPLPTRVISNGYGQEKFLPAPVKVISNGYGSSIQTDDRFLVRDGYGQEKMLPQPTRVISNGYGQPQVQEKTIIKIKTDNGYGSSLPADNRVLVRDGYGQQKFF